MVNYEIFFFSCAQLFFVIPWTVPCNLFFPLSPVRAKKGERRGHKEDRNTKH